MPLHFHSKNEAGGGAYRVLVGEAEHQVAEYQGEAPARRSAAANSVGTVAVVVSGGREVARYTNGREV